MTELVNLIRAYLDAVDTVLSIFKSKVGEPEEGKSWMANIPNDGEFLHEGISEFHRHGTGISVYYQGKFIDFDFWDRNFSDLDDDYRFMTIDVGFLAAFIESLEVKNERWIDYSLLKEDLNKMAEKGIVKNIEYNYYLQADLDEVAKTRPDLRNTL
jgi:hypothetical protein